VLALKIDSGSPKTLASVMLGHFLFVRCPLFRCGSKIELAGMKNFSDLTSQKVKKAQDTIAEILQNRSQKDGWDELWKQNVTPWDAGMSSPALVDLVNRGVLPHGLALVPGCGRGYDVRTLASPTRFVIGLEISETAAQRAREYLQQNGVPKEHATIIVCDFFQFDRNDEFDLIYDYTFLAALSPSLRPLWAQKMFALLKQNGLLLTQIFPVGDFSGGPPYAMQPQWYVSLPVGNSTMCLQS
jgi:hypothetical protein